MRRFERLNVDEFSTLHRRALLRLVGSAAAGMIGGAGLATSVWANPVFKRYPFSLGVAAGDPWPDGFVIWTRLAPDPVNGGGMPTKQVEVSYEVAADAQFRTIVQKGTTMARPELGHALHVELGGLEAGREYFYRFTAGNERSIVGRAKTLPLAGSAVSSFKFGVAGCQRYEDGYFTAFKHMANENFDLVFHYGDYIYEYRRINPGERATPVVRDMPEHFDEIYTLPDYRNRYALYKMDRDLQAAHAACAYVVSFDDHEVDNNFAGDISEETEARVPKELFLMRRAAAFQAWYEHMPLRRAQMPQGASILAHRRLKIGNLATLQVLDTRQYRSDQPCNDGWRQCKEADEPARTMLGAAQEQWLYEDFKADPNTWHVLAQQVLLMRSNRSATPGVIETHMDKWDSATAARDRLFRAAEGSNLKGLVALTGDIHNNWAGDLKANFNDEKSRTLGVEFVATSITSGGDGADTRSDIPKMFEVNPHMKFFNNHRGYVSHVVTPTQWQADFRTVEKVTLPDQPVKTRKTFIVEPNKGGLQTP